MAFTLIPWEQPKMTLMSLQDKLKKVHPELYIDTARKQVRENGLKFSALYLKRPRKASVGVAQHERNLVNEGHAKYLDALESGQMDIFITSICLDFIPEYDIFNMEYTKLAVLGWRSLGLMLINRKIASAEKVKKAFGCAGLGESDYDRASFFGKIEIAKRLANA
jgi:hypothetical protein